MPLIQISPISKNSKHNNSGIQKEQRGAFWRSLTDRNALRSNGQGFYYGQKHECADKEWNMILLLSDYIMTYEEQGQRT